MAIPSGSSDQGWVSSRHCRGTTVIAERANRTFISSVLFLDIVEYSRKPVAEQIQLKDRFNSLIAEAIRDIPTSDRIILDTGDGVAINFLGDPEDALFVAMSLRDAFAPEPDSPPVFPARIGLNLGPVRLVKDLNSQPNIIGDGINVAQRVMGFAQPGQILVSRSYYEVVSHISEGYGKLFKYEGSRTDKHVREHEIYSVGYTGARASVQSPAERARVSSREQAMQSVSASVASGTLFSTTLLTKLEPWFNNRSVAYGSAGLSVVAFASALLFNFAAEPPTATPDLLPVPQVTTVKAAAAPLPVVAAKPEKRRLFSFSREKKPRKELAKVDTPQAAQAAETTPAPAAPPPVPPAVIAFAIAPWGEVFVDGDRVGVSPPVNEVEVAPGRRKIEIRNGNFPTYTQVVEVKAEQRLRIKHKFN
jgi:hypothetical protein